MKVCFIAAPLVARTGVYRSAHQLVTEGRRRGLDWTLIVGVSGMAGGDSDRMGGVHEFTAEPNGFAGVTSIRRHIQTVSYYQDADVIISLVPQTDMALHDRSKHRVSWLRGLPWPAAGEGSAVKARAWAFLERRALGRADDVWSTTERLRSEVGPIGRTVELVTAGIEPVPRRYSSKPARGAAVWAARYNADKNPELFLRVMSGSDVTGLMYGTGPLEASLAASAPSNVRLAGWVDPAHLWDEAMCYVGTSRREAFGRSAVEAAMTGLPVVVSKAFGAAPDLYTNSELQRRFVLADDDIEGWKDALKSLATDDELWRTASQHVFENSSRLTIAASVDMVVDRLAQLARRGW